MLDTTTGLTVRELPTEEWDRLIGLPFAANGLPDPALAAIVVAEQDGRIVGVWAALTAVHLDGLWVDPAERGTTVAGRLLREMKTLLLDRGVTVSFTMVSDPQVAILAYKAGFTRYPGDLFMLQMEP